MPRKKKVGDAEQKCSSKNCKILISVVRSDNTEHPKDFRVQLTRVRRALNKTIGTETTDGTGPVEFIDETGKHKYRVTVSRPAETKKAWEKIESYEFSITKGTNEQTEVIEVTPIFNEVEPHIDLSEGMVWFGPDEGKGDPFKISLYVTQTEEKNPFEGKGTLTVQGDQVQVFADEACTSAFDLGQKIDSDQLTDSSKLELYLKGKSAGNAQLTLTLEEPGNEFVTLGDPVQKEVEAKAFNVIEPEIKVEYKAVQLDRNLSQHQDVSEEKYAVDPTYILLSLKQLADDPAFDKGAFIRMQPDNAKVYTDENCTRELDISAAILNDKLTGDEPYKLYLMGKTKGTFDLQLEVEDPNKEEFKLKGPAKEAMAVVELEMKLHEQDTTALQGIQVDPDTDPIDTYYTNLKDEALPDQKEMSDEQKVKTGRILHAQKDGNFSRAKLLLKKIDASQWPEGADEYKLVINETNTSGAVEIYDADWDGNKKTFPLEVKVSDLKAADQVFWVQGKTATDRWRDVRLDLGLDRPDGAPVKKPKRNGDWARFTVVEIKEVKVDYTSQAGQAVAWKEAEEKFYINLKADPDGRKVTIGVKLSKNLENVKVHFMLAPDKDNRKAANWGKDMPGTWKWKDITWDVKRKDKDDPKNLLHLSAETDANGYAKKELVLSRFGGDVFHPAAYLDQDPHLAKYIHGHVDLEKKKPVFAAKKITVWRKFWYQRVTVEGLAVRDMDGAEAKYQPIKTEMLICPNLQVARATVDLFNPQAIYPKYMVVVNGGVADALVVSDSNKAQFFTAFAAEADKPIKIPILVCDAQWDEGGVTAQIDPPGFLSTAFPVDLETDKLILNPPLQGGDLLVNGTWWKFERAGANWNQVDTGALSNADLTINQNRDSLYKVTVNLPAGVGAAAANIAVKIRLTVKGADGPYLGEYDAGRILSVYNPNEPVDFQNTIAHEIGHAFFQVAEAGNLPNGVPAHPHQYLSMGSHCSHDADKCMMYESGPIIGSLNRYCDVCHPYLLVQDLSRLA